jgi:glucose-6-phosphate 1-dehydrogenase
MLLPSLCALHADKLVPEKLKIVCTARSDYSDESFRDFAAQALDKFLPEHQARHRELPGTPVLPAARRQ